MIGSMNPSVFRAVASAALLFSSFSLFAQENAAQRHQMATNHLKGAAAELSTRCLSGLRTLDDWNKQRPELRRQLLDMLGLSPLPPRTPLKSKITGVLERDSYRIEKLVFQSLPGLYVTGNLYVPKRSNGPLPIILYLCGH